MGAPDKLQTKMEAALVLLFVTGVMSGTDVGYGKFWDREAVTEIGAPRSINYLGPDHSIQDRAGQCCEGCLQDYPDTTMINFIDDVQSCDCLKAAPGTTPRTEPTYIVGTCGDTAFPDIVVGETGLLSRKGVQTLGHVSAYGDSSRCCEMCNSAHPTTQIFE